MARSRHFIQRLSGFAGLILLGIAPFAVYATVRASSHKRVPPWPGDVAMVATSGTTLKQLALFHVGPSGTTVVLLPTDTTLDAPNTGVLRAATVFRLAGADLVAAGLSQTTGIDIRFWAQWKDTLSTSRAPASENLGAHLDNFIALLHRGPQSRIDNPPGQWQTSDGIRSFALDRETLQSELGVPGAAAVSQPSVASSPTPTASASFTAADPSISIEILNRGASASTISKAVSILVGAGYTSVTATTSSRAPISGIVVYYVRDRTAGQQVATFLGLPDADVKRIVTTYSTNAQVLVVIGR